jgi:hypothetical protein
MRLARLGSGGALAPPTRLRCRWALREGEIILSKVVPPPLPTPTPGKLRVGGNRGQKSGLLLDG